MVMCSYWCCFATLNMIFCLWKPLPHLPPSSPPSWSHVCHISALRETCRESHADREEEGRMSGGRSKWSSVFMIDFHPILQLSNPELDGSGVVLSHIRVKVREGSWVETVYRFSSSLLPHSDNAVPPASPPRDHDDLTASSLSAPLCPPHRQLLHTPLSFSSAKNTLLVCLFNARSVGTSRRRSDISTFAQDNIDIMLQREAWLRPAGDEAKIADLAPPGYSVLSFPAQQGGPAQNAGESPSS